MHKIVLDRITDFENEPLGIGLLKCVKAYSENEGTPGEDSAEVGDVIGGMPCYMKDDEFYHAYHVSILSEYDLADGDFCYHPEHGFQVCCDMTRKGMNEWFRSGWRKVLVTSNPLHHAFNVEAITSTMMESIAISYKNNKFDVYEI